MAAVEFVALLRTHGGFAKTLAAFREDLEQVSDLDDDLNAALHLIAGQESDGKKGGGQAVNAEKDVEDVKVEEKEKGPNAAQEKKNQAEGATNGGSGKKSKKKNKGKNASVEKEKDVQNASPEKEKNSAPEEKGKNSALEKGTNAASEKETISTAVATVVEEEVKTAAPSGENDAAEEAGPKRKTKPKKNKGGDKVAAEQPKTEDHKEVMEVDATPGAQSSKKTRKDKGVVAPSNDGAGSSKKSDKKRGRKEEEAAEAPVVGKKKKKKGKAE